MDAFRRTPFVATAAAAMVAFVALGALWALVAVAIDASSRTAIIALPLEATNAGNLIVTLPVGTMSLPLRLVVSTATDETVIWNQRYSMNGPTAVDPYAAPVTRAQRATGTYDRVWLAHDVPLWIKLATTPYPPDPALTQYDGVWGIGASSLMWAQIRRMRITPTSLYVIVDSDTWDIDADGQPAHGVLKLDCELLHSPYLCMNASVSGGAGVWIGSGAGGVMSRVPWVAYDAARIDTTDIYDSRALRQLGPLHIGQLALQPRDYTHEDRPSILEDRRRRLLVALSAANRTEIGTGLMQNALDVLVDRDNQRALVRHVDARHRISPESAWDSFALLLAVAVACMAWAMDGAFIGAWQPSPLVPGSVVAVAVFIVAAYGYTDVANILAALVVALLAAAGIGAGTVARASAAARDNAMQRAIGQCATFWSSEMLAFLAAWTVADARTGDHSATLFKAAIALLWLWRAATHVHVLCALADAAYKTAADADNGGKPSAARATAAAVAAVASLVTAAGLYVWTTRHAVPHIVSASVAMDATLLAPAIGAIVSTLVVLASIEFSTGALVALSSPEKPRGAQ